MYDPHLPSLLRISFRFLPSLFSCGDLSLQTRRSSPLSYNTFFVFVRPSPINTLFLFRSPLGGLDLSFSSRRFSLLFLNIPTSSLLLRLMGFFSSCVLYNTGSSSDERFFSPADLAHLLPPEPAKFHAFSRPLFSSLLWWKSPFSPPLSFLTSFDWPFHIFLPCKIGDTFVPPRSFSACGGGCFPPSFFPSFFLQSPLFIAIYTAFPLSLLWLRKTPFFFLPDSGHYFLPCGCPPSAPKI